MKGVSLFHQTQLELLPETQAWLSNLQTRPSNYYLSKLNTLIYNLKVAGIYPQLDRMWIFATENRDNAQVSIVNPSAKLTEAPNGGTLTWTRLQGYTSDGTHSFLNTNFSASTQGVNFTMNNAAIGIYSRTNSAVANISELGGEDAAGNGVSLDAKNGSGFIGVRLNASANTFSNSITTSLGLISMARTVSATTNAYQNGSLVTAIAAPSTAIVSPAIYVLAGNISGVVGGWSTRQISMVYMGSGSINQQAFYSIFQTFAIQTGFNV
jgi:hypothetical protein